MDFELKIIPTDLLEQYNKEFTPTWAIEFDALCESGLSIESFSFYTSVSAVFSSKIEGEQIELDSYIKHKRFGVPYQPDYTRKIDDLYEAYLFAQKNGLDEKNLSLAHAQLTKHILKKSQQGKTRKGNMYVITNDGRIEYVAASPNIVQSELDLFYNDLHHLLKQKLSFQETFFFASMLHLVFVKIHPFDDGNGRTARLLEKWFLSQKLGKKAWFVQSEKYYYHHHQTYYHNIRRLGIDYAELDYHNALPFLQMLPNAINVK